MILNGEHELPLSREVVWQHLNDPELLQICIKGCERVEQLSPIVYVASFRVRLGPVSKLFEARLDVEDSQAPEQYRLVTTMQAGMFGAVSGQADVRLDQIESGTQVVYQAEIQVEGRLAGFGLKLLGSAAERYMARFFAQMMEAIAENKQEE